MAKGGWSIDPFATPSATDPYFRIGVVPCVVFDWVLTYWSDCQNCQKRIFIYSM